MSSISDDREAQLSMMRDAYRTLRAKNPNHALLGLVALHSDEEGFSFTQEYKRRFVEHNDTWKVQGCTRYTFALESAVKDR